MAGWAQNAHIDVAGVIETTKGNAYMVGEVLSAAKVINQHTHTHAHTHTHIHTHLTAQALLVTSDDQKAVAIHHALPTSRYELIVASSKPECLSFLACGGAKCMPDVVLLDSQFRQGLEGGARCMSDVVLLDSQFRQVVRGALSA
eukprot:1136626-Pelagomonas_calceolata.AAC.3